MNNALIEEYDQPQIDENLLLRKAKLLKLVTALENLSHNADWNTLKELMFDGLAESASKQLLSEVTKNELNTPEIYRLQGKLSWAKRYNELYRLAETYKTEINSINKKLNENASI